MSISVVCNVNLCGFAVAVWFCFRTGRFFRKPEGADGVLLSAGASYPGLDWLATGAGRD